MRKNRKQQKVESIKLDFSEENVTSFGGLALVERFAQRLGMWTKYFGALPKRPGNYSWEEIVKSAVGGLLSGSRGSVVCEETRGDRALLDLLGLKRAPSETTLWRSLEELGSDDTKAITDRSLRTWAYLILNAASRPDLLFRGFIPIFGDGTLLEGSTRREGTKTIENKGQGLLWSTWFVGPVLASQMLAKKGEGEQSNLCAMFPDLLKDVLTPLGFTEKALVLMDSLHGDGPTCTMLEKESLNYILGANKLKTTRKTLEEQPDLVWCDTGSNENLGWSESAVCICSIQCDSWSEKRTLIGRRWKRDGELLTNYSGVMTSLTKEDVSHLPSEYSFAEKIWLLYDGKQAYENQFKDILIDMDGHHPPCNDLSHNSGYYGLLSLAYNLARGVDLIGGKSPERGRSLRHDGKALKRRKPLSMRLWRMRRRYFALPGRIVTRGRTATVTLLGVCKELRKEFASCFRRICRC